MMKTRSVNWKRLIQPAALCGAALMLAACGSEQKADIKTAETEGTKKAIESYEANSTDAAKANVEKAFAELDGEIRELEVRVENTTGEARAEANTKLSELKQRKLELKGDFTEAKFNALIEDVKKSVR